MTDISRTARHFEEAAIGLRAATAVFRLDNAAVHFHAGLRQRNDELLALRVIAHRLPVLAAGGAGACGHPIAGALLQDVGTIGDLAFRAIFPDEDVLVDGLLGVDERARLAVELPEDARLADIEGELLAVHV